MVAVKGMPDPSLTQKCALTSGRPSPFTLAHIWVCLLRAPFVLPEKTLTIPTRKLSKVPGCVDSQSLSPLLALQGTAAKMSRALRQLSTLMMLFAVMVLLET